MSFSRNMYDSCAYGQELSSQTSALSWQLDPIKFENCSKCRMQLGIVGGTAVSHVSGNLVDLENDLRGANRPNTHCARYKFLPNGQRWVKGNNGGGLMPSKTFPRVATDLVHLNPCQMFDFGPVPMPPPVDLSRCPR